MRAEQAMRIVHGPVEQGPTFLLGDRRSRRGVHDTALAAIDALVIPAVVNLAVVNLAAIDAGAVGNIAVIGRIAVIDSTVIDIIDNTVIINAGLAGDPLLVPHGQSPTSCLARAAPKTRFSTFHDAMRSGRVSRRNGPPERPVIRT